MQWIPFLPKGGGLIQVYIGGHPPIPLAQNTVSILVFFLQFFQVLNVWVCFEALNDFFLSLEALRSYRKACIGSFKICTPWLDLSDGLLSSPNEDRMKK
jgi:hypothetical protein